MTREEAIEWLKHMKVFIGYDAESPMVKEMQSALDMAIKALEQEPCDDYIRREAVIRLVEQYPNIIGNRCSGLIADIKHLPSVTPSYNSIKTELEQQTRWIPVSERLPDTTDEVLVTDGVDMMVAWHDYTLVGWASFDSNFDTDVPIKAWMPLPEPYKAESE